MAVAFDAVGPSSSGTEQAVNAMTWTHSAASGAAVLVWAMWDASSTGVTQTCTATYNSVSMTQVLAPTEIVNGTNTGWVVAFGICGVASGSQTVAVSWGTGTPDHTAGGSVSFTGAASTPAAAFNAGSIARTASNTTTLSSTVVTSSASNMVAGFNVDGDNSTPSASNGTQRWANTAVGTNGTGGPTCCSTQAATGGTVTSTFAWTGSADGAGLSVEIKQATSSTVGPNMSQAIRNALQYGGRGGSKSKRTNNDSWVGTKPSFGGLRGGVQPIPPMRFMMRAGGTARSLTPGQAMVGGTGISSHHHFKWQRARAVVGGMGQCAAGIKGRILVTFFAVSGVAVPRSPYKRHRANVGPFGTLGAFLYGVLQPNAPPRQLNSSVVPPRGLHKRAIVGNNNFCGDGQQGPQPPPNGSIQPRPTLPPRRSYARGIVGGDLLQGDGIAGPVNQTGRIQSRATIAIPRRTRARGLVGGDNFPGDGLSGPQPNLNGTIQSLTTRQPRHYPSRAVTRSIQVFLHVAGTQQPRTTVPVPRRYPSRAVTRSNQVYLQPAGKTQPRATIAVPRRYPSRAVIRFTAVYISTNGQTQPRATILVPRRYSSRAGQWAGFASFYAVIVEFNGTVQPWPTIPVPRRKSSRAGQWFGRQVIYPIQQPGTQQPITTAPHRRGYARAVIRYSAPYTNVPPNGTVQPRVFVISPRRKTSRVVYHGSQPFLGLQTGKTQPLSTRQPRRTSARAVIRSGQGPVNQTGKTQPRTTIAVPRRYPSRAVVHSQFGPQPNLNGTRQPRATIAIPRRYPSRVVFRSNAVYYILPRASGVTQPRTTVPVPRRYPSRQGLWRNAIGAVQIHYAGTRQPWTTRPVPRRYPARQGLWRSYANHYTPLTAQPGTRQPRATVPVPRRYPSRAFIHIAKGFAASGAGKIQPRPTLPPRRTSARVVTFHGPFYPGRPNGHVQPRATLPIARRYPSRAVVRSTPLPFDLYAHPGTRQPRPTLAPRRGTARAVVNHGPFFTPRPPVLVQPRATVPVPRRRPSRAVVVQYPNVIALPETHYTGKIQPKIAVPRRYPSRAVVRSSALPFDTYAHPGKVQPRPTLAPRRGTSRAVVVHTTLKLTFEQHYTGTTQPRATTGIPRRTASRAVVRNHSAGPNFYPRVFQQRLVITRRTRARGVWLSIKGQAHQNAGHVQSRCTLPPRRTTQRAVVRNIKGRENFFGKPGKTPFRPQISRRTGIRVTWARLYGVFTYNSSVTIRFNILETLQAPLMISFEIGEPVPSDQQLLPGLPWLSPYDGRIQMSEQPWISPYDGRIESTEEPNGPMQGGAV